MLVPLQITYRGVDASEALSAEIRRMAGKLERFYRHIGGCRVLVEQPHHHHHTGEHFHVRIDLTVPGEELVVEREPERRTRNEDPYAAVHDAFHAARRQVQDWIRRRRG